MKTDNDLILERMRGVPMQEGTLKDKFDPRNPNVPNANDNDQERACQKCGRPTKSEEAWINGQIWCHPCADR